MLGGAFPRLCVSAAAAVTLLLGGAPRVAGAQNAPRTHLLIVTGSSGEPRFAQQFQALATTLRGVALDRFGIPESRITWLAENPATDPGAITARSTRDEIQRAIDGIAGRAAPGDAVLILLIGHGSSDGTRSTFNVPGPDVSDAEFRSMLGKLSGQSVAFINASSASGDFVKSLSGRNRIVVTATKSGFERNETVFAQHFVTAYAKDGADADKDGRVSLLEAFHYARREVQREYESNNKLQTEHAVLDDDGDGTGRADPAERGPDGGLASRFFLQPAVTLTAAAAADPRAAPLLAEQARLQAQLDTLRLARGVLPEADYQKRLEDLLLRISENAAALRALGVRKP